MATNIKRELSVELDLEEFTLDFSLFLEFVKYGHVDRYILTVEEKPGIDPITGVQTKDIVISNDPEITGRIFLPKMDETGDDTGDPKSKKGLQLFVHFHGGSFCTGSAFSPITKEFLTHFVYRAQVVAITVNFRLAPEYPLPIAYNDCWAAFKWIASHTNGNGSEPWLNDYVDFNRVFVGGESSGANLAHDVAIRASVEPIGDGLKLVGLLAIQPYFATREITRLIQYLYPSSRELNNEPKLNLNIDPRLCKLACDKVLICVAENDKFKERGLTYYYSLKSRWEGNVELVETLGEGHCFHLLNTKSPNIEHLMAKLVSFVSKDD
ncbi:2-hydroxyisoflavanone dehydratase-like [Chenopodium quinoa]|uniref:2-hydroxyisoflavanone dehydratase-like n=1 Tax=Chenopodium quinoa TaxID=63459 RepID=UPI000B78BD36|nr:2-hydroxyisoflavanone dehydratase-like [Chenopodium quinoa]